MKTQINNYDVGIYCRLSRDDNNGNSESMSISNQREMLKAYVKDNGWSISDIYIDDGYSGTTFERPEFSRMIQDIEAGKINLVITKDLSRLGRNYVQTGQYTDFFFPRHGVRYIAVNDNHDSESDIDNDITPFKNILNEMYAKDISKKVKSARKTSAKQGKFMGSVTPFGYIKNPLNKYQLIPDEEAALIMQRIFKLFADGNAARHIADILNRESVSSPAIYYYSKLGKQHPNPKVSNTWTSSTISQLLTNEVYLGNMVQGKRAVTSFKTGERHFTDPSEWIVVEGTHEPLVDMETWEAVQKRKAVKYQMTRICHTGEISLFAGLLKCSDCGSALVFNTKNMRGKTYMGYKCSRYIQHGKYICSIHSVSLELLEETILQDIQYNAKLAVSDHDRFIKRLMCLEKDEQEEKRLILERKMREANNRIKTVDGLSKKLFEDRYSGNVPDSIFKKMMSDYENERNELQNNIDYWKLELSKIKSADNNVSKWVENISKYTEIPSITRPVLLELIDSITVSEKQVVNGVPQQEIIINYKFIGNLK